MLKMLCLVRIKLSAFGEHAEIYTLHDFESVRQPGLARRSLLAQVSASIRPTSINLAINLLPMR